MIERQTTLREVGEVLGVCGERVRCIENAALRKLRKRAPLAGIDASDSFEREPSIAYVADLTVRAVVEDAREEDWINHEEIPIARWLRAHLIVRAARKRGLLR